MKQDEHQEFAGHCRFFDFHLLIDQRKNFNISLDISEKGDNFNIRF